MSFKTGGPEVRYEYGTVQCCRTWPVVTATFTWSDEEDRWIRETWWWRKCGICGQIPILVPEEKRRRIGNGNTSSS